MFVLLRPTAMHRVYAAFARRFRSQDSEIIPGWFVSVLVLVPKPGKNPELVEGWRPICLVSTIFKWHGAFVWASMDTVLRPLPPWILGFRGGGGSPWAR